MKHKTIIMLMVFFGCISTVQSSMECDSDLTLKYIQVIFSSINYTNYHKDLIQKGYSWEGVQYCNELAPEKDDHKKYNHTAQLSLFYCKGGRKKGNMFREVHIEVTFNTKNGGTVVKVFKDEKGIIKSDYPLKPEEIDLSK